MAEARVVFFVTVRGRLFWQNETSPLSQAQLARHLDRSANVCLSPSVCLPACLHTCRNLCIYKMRVSMSASCSSAHVRVCVCVCAYMYLYTVRQEEERAHTRTHTHTCRSTSYCSCSNAITYTSQKPRRDGRLTTHPRLIHGLHLLKEQFASIRQTNVGHPLCAAAKLAPVRSAKEAALS